MKKRLSIITITCGLLLPSAAFSAPPEFDLRFSKDRGQIVVVDYFNTIHKSNTSIEDVSQMRGDINRLQKKMENFERSSHQQDEIRKLQRKVDELERKSNQHDEIKRLQRKVDDLENKVRQLERRR